MAIDDFDAFVSSLSSALQNDMLMHPNTYQTQGELLGRHRRHPENPDPKSIIRKYKGTAREYQISRQQGSFPRQGSFLANKVFLAKFWQDRPKLSIREPRQQETVRSM